jgi:hypothetical protein
MLSRRFKGIGHTNDMLGVPLTEAARELAANRSSLLSLLAPVAKLPMEIETPLPMVVDENSRPIDAGRVVDNV